MMCISNGDVVEPGMASKVEYIKGPVFYSLPRGIAVSAKLGQIISTVAGCVSTNIQAGVLLLCCVKLL